ncbi:MAG: Flp pilus assembly protein CpaB [Alphaproteobacteria bacterium]|nr:Flp pilus assembly protein CpaB [Alphaproteobacteria bacterium]
MASRKISLLAAATIVAIGTAALVKNMSQPEPKQAQSLPEIAAIEIAIAAHDLPTGTILKESDLKWSRWAANADTSAMLVKGKTVLANYAGAVVRDGFRAGDPIMASRVAHSKDQGFLAAVLTPGMRAMSVSLSPTSQVAGFIFPGDRVDVILTHSFSRKDVSALSDRHVSETVLRKVRVLALDQRSNNQSKDPKVSQLATLEVSPKDAEKLALAVEIASEQGGTKTALTLILRSLAADEAIDAKAEEKFTPTWDNEVSRSYPDSNGDDGLIHRVQVMRGKNTTENVFERQR